MKYVAWRKSIDVSEERIASIIRVKAIWKIHAGNRTLLSGGIVGLVFDPENVGDKFLRKVGKTSTRLHGVTSQKITLFIATVKRTTN
jgi:hypothetical protein